MIDVFLPDLGAQFSLVMGKNDQYTTLFVIQNEITMNKLVCVLVALFIFCVTMVTGKNDQKYFKILEGYRVVNSLRQFDSLTVYGCAAKCTSLARVGVCELAGYDPRTKTCQIAANNVTGASNESTSIVITLLNMCGTPEVPIYGSADVTNGRTLSTFSCNPGYLLHGVTTVECVDGFWNDVSPTCEDIDECTSSPCANGATCHNIVNAYSCDCLPGYTGVNCETEINECASSPCRIGATCVDEINGYSCLCSPGYTGTHCNKDVDECSSSPCVNGATCQNNVNAYACQCLPGYMGVNCATDINECSSSPCINSGTCIDMINSYRCSCTTFFTGSRCEQDCYPGTPWQYSGKRSTTQTGITCQRWDSQSPHPHPHTDLQYFPETNLADAQNYCRNPESGEYDPWCMTSDPGTEWDYCNVIPC